MGYLGKERRIHRIFVTRNSEYHVRRNVCVGVRDRRSGEWLAGHMAFYWDRLDAWFDEDEEVFGHLRDPFHRVDARRSSRRVVVRRGDGGTGQHRFKQQSGRDAADNDHRQVDRQRPDAEGGVGAHQLGGGEVAV